MSGIKNFPTVTNPELGPKPSTESVSVVGASGGGGLPVQITSPIGLQVAATSVSVVLATDGTLPLPTGASTAAKQDTGNASLASIDTKTPALGQTTMAASQPVTIASNQTAISISAASLPLPTGASTSANQTTANSSLASIDGKLNSLGQKTSAASVPVVLASDGTLPLPIGAATEATLSNLNSKVTAVNTGAVVVSSSALPTGASTSVLQTTGNTSLSSIDGKLGSLGQKTMAGSTPVVLASDQAAIPVTQSGTWNLTNISGTVSLPTGASTSALQTTGNTSLSSIDGKLADNYGVATAALRTASQVGNASGVADFGTGASSAQTLRISNSNETSPKYGRTVVTTVRNDYSSVNVTSGAWVQLVASLGSDVNALDLFDSSGQTLEIGTGAAASEVRLFLVYPGGNGQLPVRIASGTRVSIRAVSATANAGEIDINFMG